jgi:DNA-binding NarL/FixJ family response regulator
VAQQLERSGDAADLEGCLEVPSLVGRESQLSIVRRMADSLSRGRGGMLWIDGEAGMGTTALVDVLVARVRHRGDRVLRAAGDALMEDLPLWLMSECLGVSSRCEDPDGREIATLLRGGPCRVSHTVPHQGDGASDGLSAAASPGERLSDRLPAVQKRMVARVRRLCARGPVLLVAEDLQWSDGRSLQVWDRLARATGQIPLLLVGTARPGLGHAAVEPLRRCVAEPESATGSGPLRAVLDLPPLTEEEAARLAGRVAGGEPGDRLRTELARAGGNPLYIKSMVDAFVADGLLSPTHQGSAMPSSPTVEFTGSAGAMPDLLADLVGRGLASLSGESMGIMRVAALLGTSLDPAQLAAVAVAAPESVARALKEAKHAGAVRGHGRPAFRNELVRQVLASQIPLTLRRGLHGHIARTLAELGLSPDVVVHHLCAAEPELDAWAVNWLARAPQHVFETDPSAAVPLLRRALGIADAAVEPIAAAGRRRRDLAMRLARVLYLAERDEEVIEVAQGLARDTDDRELAVRMTELALRAMLRIGRWRQVFGLAREALRHDQLPPLWRARLGSLASLASAQLGAQGHARETAHAALAEAHESGDALTVALAHHAASLSAPLAEAIDHNRRALVALGEDTESADLCFVLATNRMMWLQERGERAEYRAQLKLLRGLSELSSTSRSRVVLLRVARVAHLGGDWDEALDLLDEVKSEDLPLREQVRAFSLRARIHLHRGERELGARALAALEQAAAGIAEADVPHGPLAAARADAADANGEPGRALTLLADLVGPDRGDWSLRDEQVPMLVRLALSEKDAELASTVTERFERRARVAASPRRITLAHFCRGQVDDDPEALLAAAETMAAASWPFDAAAAFEVAAVRLAVGGETRPPEPKRARTALAAAVRLYAAIGAQWDIRRADASLRAHGVRRGSHSAHRRETVGWGALTASERRVALLVGKGWSNPGIAAELMLSRHTVETHVSSVLGKLQLDSRIEIVRAVARNAHTGRLGEFGPDGPGGP